MLEDLGHTVADGNDRTLIGDNPIYVRVDDENMILHDVTKEKHIFHNPAQMNCPRHPGQHAQPVATRCSQIRREVVVRDDGVITVRTTGEGAGPYPDLNEGMGPFMFRGVDDLLRSAAVVPEIVPVTHPIPPQYGGGPAVVTVPGALDAVVNQCEDDPLKSE